MGATYYFGKIESATWGVVRAFWLPNGASVRRRIRRAPLAHPRRVQPQFRETSALEVYLNIHRYL